VQAFGLKGGLREHALVCKLRDSTVLSDHGVSEEEVEPTNSLMQSADIMNEIKTRALPR